MNWVVGNLQNAISTWNEKLDEIWNLVTQSPETFRDGAIWDVVITVHGAVQAIALGLLVLFFVTGILKTCANITEVKRPEQALKLFIRFAITKVLITHGLELMTGAFEVTQGLISTIMTSSGMGEATPSTLPTEIITAVEACGFFKSIPLWAVTLIGSLFVTVISFIMILTVYGRFFKIYIYTIIAPILLSSFAGEPTQSVGTTFLKSYCAKCMEGVVIIIACIIFSLYATSTPVVDTSAEAVTMVWKYIGDFVFQMLVLVGTVKMSDAIVREITGL